MTPAAQCLLSPDSPAVYFVLGLCLTVIIGAAIAALALWRMYRRVCDIVDVDGLEHIFPDQTDHMRRRK